MSKEYALTKEDADKIYPELQSAISEQMNISLSFDGIENCSNVFLRHTIGAAYLNYGVEVDKFIKITGIHPDDILLPLQIKKFKERALANHITDEGERIEETQGDMWREVVDIINGKSWKKYKWFTIFYNNK